MLKNLGLRLRRLRKHGCAAEVAVGDLRPAVTELVYGPLAEHPYRSRCAGKPRNEAVTRSPPNGRTNEAADAGGGGMGCLRGEKFVIGLGDGRASGSAVKGRRRLGTVFRLLIAKVSPRCIRVSESAELNGEDMAQVAAQHAWKLQHDS